MQGTTVVTPIDIGHSASPPQVDPRAAYLEQSVGAAKAALLRELGVYDGVLQAMPQVPSCHVLISKVDLAVMAMEDFVETDILLILDSGCFDHIVDMADAQAMLA